MTNQSVDKSIPRITKGSLFSGIEAFALAGTRVGITPVWSSEIEPFPIAVSKYHFPGIKHLGDISKINGAEIEPVDIVTLGSPCQDLSVAGEREGLGGQRSGLFVEAIRIIRELKIDDEARNAIFFSQYVDGESTNYERSE